MNKILNEDIRLFAERFSLAERLRGCTVAVTGATGLLGSCMVRCLLALNIKHNLGLRVLAVVRSLQKAQQMFGEENDNLIFHMHDFSADAPFSPTETIDYLIHFASPTASKYFVEHPVETMNTVYNSSREVLEYARQCNLQSILLASTLEVYGTITDDTHPLKENTMGDLNPMETRSSYPMAKRAAEALFHNYAVQYGISAKVARLAQTFGAGVDSTDNRVFAQFARSIIAGNDIILHTEGNLARCYCYTTDAVSAILFILLRGESGEAYNVANPETYISIRSMAELLVRTFNPKLNVRIELKEGQGYSPTTKLRLDTTRIESLGWRPNHNLHSMFERLIESLL